MSGAGKEYLVVTSHATGKIQDKPFTSDIVRYFLLENGKITSYSIKGTNLKDNMSWTDYAVSFDWTNLAAAVEYHDHEKKQDIVKTVRIDHQLVAIQDIDIYLTSLPGRKISSEKVTTLLPGGQTFGLLLKLIDQPETVSVKGVSILSRRVEVKPDLWLISNFIPSVNYWLRAEAPYEIVRYAGAIGGPGAPEVVQEIWEENGSR